MLDHAHVVQLIAKKSDQQLPLHDFDIVVRGWNVLLAELFKRWGALEGIPLRASTPEMRGILLNWLHVCGRAATFNWAAEMVRQGMVEATVRGNEIELRVSERASVDIFDDQIDRMRHAEHDVALLNRFPRVFEEDDVPQLRQTMAELVFPWPTAQGIMTGYTTAPEIHAHFLRSTLEHAMQWRNDAGIHPDARLPGCSGRVLAGVVHALMSFHLKHILFVSEAKLRHPEINAHMSLSRWGPRGELLESLVVATGFPASEVDAALDLVTVGPGDADYFATERAPSLPLLIRMSDEYLLFMVSGIFRNPFHLVRMLRSSTSSTFQDALREHRETWMAEDLYALFQGSRFQCVDGQTELNRSGQKATDIDAAVFDSATNELLLFQLKWQDFSTSSVKSQRSKAKNFTGKVSSWAGAVTSWVDDFGSAALCAALRLKLHRGKPPDAVRLIAIGRSSARFRGYGYDLGSELLSLSWSQFLRLRYVIGPGQDFFAKLKEHVAAERETPVAPTPLPYVIDRNGWRVTFIDLWSGLDDGGDDEVRAWPSMEGFEGATP